MANNTLIQVPQNLGNENLFRFLSSLVQKLDVAFGYRGDNAFVTSTQGQEGSSDLEQELKQFVVNNYSPLDGSKPYLGVVSYNTLVTLSAGTNLVHKNYVDTNFYTQNYIDNNFYTQTYTNANFSNNPQQPAEAPLSYTAPTASPVYAQAELQQAFNDIESVSDKIDSLIVKLQNANILS